MNRELQVLYKIFELELAPPFSLQQDQPTVPDIFNKHSEKIGWYSVAGKCIYPNYRSIAPILTKIKQTFNIDEISNDDLTHITKHLFFWVRTQFPLIIERLEWLNYDTGRSVIYYE